jgi:hypothetical protein
LAFGLVFIPLVCGLIIAEGRLGHPLLPWSWRAGFDGSDIFTLIPFIFLGLVVTISWFVHRRRESRKVDHAPSR